MRSRLPVGYVVKIEGSEVTLNLLDMHRGQLASHIQPAFATHLVLRRQQFFDQPPRKAGE